MARRKNIPATLHKPNNDVWFVRGQTAGGYDGRGGMRYVLKYNLQCSNGALPSKEMLDNLWKHYGAPYKLHPYLPNEPIAIEDSWGQVVHFTTQHYRALSVARSTVTPIRQRAERPFSLERRRVARNTRASASVPPQRLLEQKSSKLTATRFRAQSPPVLRSRDEHRSSATTMPRAPREASKERSVEPLKTYREPFRQPVIPQSRPLPVVGGPHQYGRTHSLQQLPQLYVSPSLQSLHGY